MGPDLPLAQHAVTVALNLTVALVTGAAVSAAWLARRRSGWAASRLDRLRRLALAGALCALLAGAAALWLEAAAMAEVPVARAGTAAWAVLTSTHYGSAAIIGALALLAIALLAAGLHREKYARAWAPAVLLALAVFLYSRSMVSHAAADGDLSLAVALHWLHLAAASLWVGEVVVAGLIILPGPAGALAADRLDRAGYVGALSLSATLALGAIVLSGLFAAWHNLGSIGRLLDHPYGTILLIKLVLVGLAVGLGALNRFRFMPLLLANLYAGAADANVPGRRFARVLQAEAVVLAGVLVLAVQLAATAPPLQP